MPIKATSVIRNYGIHRFVDNFVAGRFQGVADPVVIGTGLFLEFGFVGIQLVCLQIEGVHRFIEITDSVFVGFTCIKFCFLVLQGNAPFAQKPFAATQVAGPLFQRVESFQALLF